MYYLHLNRVITFCYSSQIFNQTQAASDMTNEIDNHIHLLKARLTDLQRNITDNGNFAKRVVEESANIMKNAQKTKDESVALHDKYDTAKIELDHKLNNIKSTKERANEVFKKAFNLVTKVTKSQGDVEKLQNSAQGTELENLENQLQMLIKRMNKSTKDLEDKVGYYKTCLGV